MLIAAAAAVYLFFQKSAPETLGDLEAQIVRAKQAGTADTSVVGRPRRTAPELEALQAKYNKLRASLANNPNVSLSGTPSSATLRYYNSTKKAFTNYTGNVDDLQKFVSTLPIHLAVPAVVSLG